MALIALIFIMLLILTLSNQKSIIIDIQFILLLSRVLEVVI